ncbi:hypothetical protein ACTD5D_35900 [Nocardia takedensis]|uniref:hypothetical protein n=1 Tax=Nocardia takedensis TaxID=259390 RepID=UPI0002DCC884|nr:hypothetical protein [Nocardia takedensis]
MSSERDAKDDESGGARSEFGPPTGDFGPPLGDFGPPLEEVRPPIADFGEPTGIERGWSVPQPPGELPAVGWRPAGDGPPPAPPEQFRAPEAAPPEVEETVRHAPASPPSGGVDAWWSPTDTGEIPKPPEPPRRPEPGLSWADDPIAKRLAPGSSAVEPKSSGGGSRLMLLGVAAGVVLVIAVIGTIVALTRGGGEEPGGGTVRPIETTAALSCPASRDGKVTVGNGPGGTTRGADAILGFQYAFYVDRNGERVRGFVAPDAANISTADVIQSAISEQIPPGTTHCLRITEVAVDTFEVDLTEHRPDGTTTVYRQTVTTVEREGRILIFAIDGR